MRARRAIPGFPGAADQFADVPIDGQPGHQRVLARAAAEDENSHCTYGLGRFTGLHDEPDGERDYFG